MGNIFGYSEDVVWRKVEKKRLSN